MPTSLKFPKDFIWGTATSAHQTEGNNTNSDWWQWENRSPKTTRFPFEPSLKACDSYTRYEEDLDLARGLNNNAIRLSIEWARIEPKNGVFDDKELEHYKKVLTAAKMRGLKTFVTLHHFTNPSWYFKKGGWKQLKASFYFARYAKKVAESLDDLIDVYLTINEPQVYALWSYVNGIWPPNETNFFASFMVQLNLMLGHRKAYDAIKSVSLKPVGLVKHIVWYQPGSKSIWDTLTARFLYFLNCEFFIHAIKSKLDLLGINYYFTSIIRNFAIDNPTKPVSDLAWWINYPGLELILLRLKKYNLPIYITENGIADAKDTLREEFIKGMLSATYVALKKGADVRGYFYWSLIDNYEWHNGFWPRFGLVEIDRENNLKRIPRKSYHYYATICKTGEVIHA